MDKAKEISNPLSVNPSLFDPKNSENLDKRIEAIKKFIKENPLIASPDPYSALFVCLSNKAINHYKSSKLAEAVQCNDDLIEILNGAIVNIDTILSKISKSHPHIKAFQTQQASCYNNLSYTYHSNSLILRDSEQFTKAKKAAHEAIKFFKNKDNTELAELYTNWGNYSFAELLNLAKNSLSLKEKNQVIGKNLKLINWYEGTKKDLKFKGFNIDPLNHLSELYFNNGMLYEKISDNEKAIESYNESINSNPSNFAAYENSIILSGELFEKLSKENNNIKALEAIDKMLLLTEKLKIKKPDSSLVEDSRLNDLYLNKGILLFEKFKDYEKAKECFEKAYSINPQDLETLNYLQLIYLQLDLYDKSLTLIEELILLEPKSLNHKAVKSNILYDLGRYEESMLCADNVLRYNPNCGTSILAKSKIEYIYRDYQKSLKLLEESQKWGYDLPDSYMLKGLLFDKMGNHEEALLLVQKAIGLDLKDANIYNNQGRILYNLKRFDEAIASYDKAIEIALTRNDKRELFISYNNKAVLLQELNEFEGALDLYKRSLELNSSSFQVLWNIALCNFKLGKYKEASESYDFIKSDAKEDESKEIAVVTELLNSSPIELLATSKIESFRLSLEEQKDTSLGTIATLLEEVAVVKLPKIKTKQKYSIEDKTKICKLIREYLSTNESSKKSIDIEFTSIIQQTDGLEACIKNLFTRRIDTQSIIDFDEILATKINLLEQISKNQKFIHNFCQYQKSEIESAIKIAKTEDSGNSNLVLSKGLEGLHEIKMGSGFKAKWFFKFSTKIIEQFSSVLSHIIDRINDLSIIPEDQRGEVGFKKHEVKINCGTFSMLKLSGLKEDEQIFSTKMLLHHNIFTDTEEFLSVLDSSANHNKISEIISSRSNHFLCEEVGAETFYSIASDW